MLPHELFYKSFESPILGWQTPVDIAALLPRSAADRRRTATGRRHAGNGANAGSATRGPRGGRAGACTGRAAEAAVIGGRHPGRPVLAAAAGTDRRRRVRLLACGVQHLDAAHRLTQ